MEGRLPYGAWADDPPPLPAWEDTVTDTHAYQPARRWRRLTAAAAVAALGAAGVSVVSASEAAHASAPLRVHASAISKDIAATVHPGLLDNLTYRALVATEFNAVDARHALTWEETQPDHGRGTSPPATR